MTDFDLAFIVLFLIFLMPFIGRFWHRRSSRRS